MFGRISPSRIFSRDSPIASAARTKSRSTISSAAPRVDARDARRRRDADDEHEQPELRADGRDGDEREHDRGKARITSIARISTSSSQRARVRGDEADRRCRARGRATVATIASPRTERPPQRKRLSTSRPRLSVPNVRSSDGAYGAPTNSVGRVRREERADQRERRRGASDEREADLRPRLPPAPRAAASTSGRRAAEPPARRPSAVGAPRRSLQRRPQARADEDRRRRRRAG